MHMCVCVLLNWLKSWCELHKIQPTGMSINFPWRIDSPALAMTLMWVNKLTRQMSVWRIKFEIKSAVINGVCFYIIKSRTCSLRSLASDRIALRHGKLCNLQSRGNLINAGRINCHLLMVKFFMPFNELSHYVTVNKLSSSICAQLR